MTRQLTACPSANSQECSGNGVRNDQNMHLSPFVNTLILCIMQICSDLNKCSCNAGFNGSNCNSSITEARGEYD